MAQDEGTDAKRVTESKQPDLSVVGVSLAKHAPL
jgi:hypothetical protein